MPLSPTDSACPEKRLLLHCARTRIQPPIEKKIQELAAGPLDWDFVLSDAADNAITPLLNLHLRGAAANIAPQRQMDRLNSLARANAVRSLLLAAELIKIVDRFRFEGIEAIPYKGPVLAAQAYGDVSMREFEDLDIILRQRHMAKANEIMVSLGYAARFPWILSPGAAASLIPGEYNYRDEVHRVMVELHTEVTLRHFPLPPDLDDLAKRLVTVGLSGHEVRTFGPEDGLILLCIHGAKDFWERLSWVADISELVQAQPGLDWDQVFGRAESWHTRRMLHLGLALAERLLDAPLPPEIASRVREDREATSLASEAERRLLSRGWQPLDAAGRLRFRRRTMEGYLAGWNYSLRLAVVPAEEDWLSMRLPRSLAPLYVAFRPFRLLLKYGMRDSRSARPSG
ncbi:MAG TPA: nucleotidyltransferase family protein [Candidatus Acidoferrales bacterium]|nr:nucleotidyltransferase family protein [Candidatus Acidoferrales bacterium]